MDYIIYNEDGYPEVQGCFCSQKLTIPKGGHILIRVKHDFWVTISRKKVMVTPTRPKEAQ